MTDTASTEAQASAERLIGTVAAAREQLAAAQAAYDAAVTILRESLLDGFREILADAALAKALPRLRLIEAAGVSPETARQWATPAGLATPGRGRPKLRV